MLRNKIDSFSKNIILVFLGTSLVNILNLLYQLLLAHRMSGVDFAAFNSLLSIFMLISAPLSTLQIGVAKYIAEFSAQKQPEKIKFFLTYLAKKISLLAVLTFLIFLFFNSYVMERLKIFSVSGGYILALLLALSWIIPLLMGALQGLELFKWLMSSSIISGVLKLAFTFVFIGLGFNIAGALGAFLVATFIGIAIAVIPLAPFFYSTSGIDDSINFKEFFSFLFPVAISSFCFMALVTSDMVLVKYFFTLEEAGFYSLAQMLGKIFLFLPGAISMVMFPKAAGLNVRNVDSRPILARSLLYACVLCIVANIGYNLFPSFVLQVLTGKASSSSIILGRFFAISMTFFTLLYILITYFLSLKDLRFIKYLVLSIFLQFLAIILFHKSLIQIQLILCINSVFIFFIHLLIVYRNGKPKRKNLYSYACL